MAYLVDEVLLSDEPDVDGADVLAAVDELAVSAGAAAGQLGACAPDDGSATAGADVLAAPPRKSVTYQPVPFNWKPAAVTCFLKVALPQVGQSVSCGSDIFCNTSLAKPHASQRYA